MRINYNATAMRANNALNVADNKVASSLQKLSSGFKVNSAKDNPSGYAIGRRMNTQIEGVSVATQNANTGISIIETADGALSEVHEMLQRMNELAIKGATGTLTTADRAIVNEEVEQLKKEILRIAEDTEFNGQPLLNGCFDLKGYTNNLDVKVGYYDDDVLKKVYTIDALQVFYLEDGKIDLDATKASFVPGLNFPKGVEIESVGENCVTIKGDNNFEITLDLAQDSVSQVIDGEVDVTTAAGDTVTVKTVYCGSSLLGNPCNVDLTVNYDANGDIDTANLPTITLDNGLTDVTCTSINGNILEFTSASDPDFVLQIEVPETSDPNSTLTTGQFGVNYSGDGFNLKGLEIDITGIGAMDTQIGPNEGQSLAIRIPTISLQRLGITNANTLTQESSNDAIVAIKSAISYVSAVRSRLGAYQNRLEHTVSSLDITNENMTSSYSRIMDVDISEEMTNYTTQQVVEQAAVSMLAQANERPSQVLQLLQ